MSKEVNNLKNSISSKLSKQHPVSWLASFANLNRSSYYNYTSPPASTGGIKFKRIRKNNYLYWFRWLELGKNMAFDKRVEQMLISACQMSNYTIVKMIRCA